MVIIASGYLASGHRKYLHRCRNWGGGGTGGMCPPNILGH